MWSDMELPNYFFADLPPEAALSAETAREACRTLKRNREQFLAARPTQNLVDLLARVGREWLDPDNPIRRFALAEGPEATGFSTAVLRSGLDAFFQELTVANLDQLLRQDLGHVQRLDDFLPSERDPDGLVARAHGPEMLVHFTAGNIPIPALMSIVLGVLLRSAQFIKCASGSSFLPRLFAHSLYAADPKLGSCLEVAEWPGGRQELEAALFDESDCVTATGNDETLTSIRLRLPPGCRFVGYGHRVSFAFLDRESLAEARELAQRAAQDVAAWDQWGCLSPHIVYVQRGGAVSPSEFAALLAEELATLEANHPRGALSPPEAAHVATRRDFYRIRADASEATRLWASPGSTAWTVVFEDDPLFQNSCLNRFVYVKAAENLAEVLRHADKVRGRVSTVALAAAPGQITRLAQDLARWGVNRICSVGAMQRPPLTWRHDGRPALGELVSWTEWETGTNER